MSTSFPKFDDLRIEHDFLFKKVMHNKRICKHLLEEILQAKIEEITYQEVEHTLDAFYDSRGVRLDVIIGDEKQTRYNLEMQVKNVSNPQTRTYVLPKRTRYYQAMIDVDSLKKGQSFYLLPPTYIIFICAFDFFNKGNYIYTFKKRCLENLDLEYPDEATTILLNTKGTHGNISKDIKSFFEYVNKHIVTSEFTQEIVEEIVQIKGDEKARLEYMSLETFVQDNRYEAYNEGLSEGFAKGEADGLAKEKIATAKRMLMKGNRSLEEIAEVTELSLADVKKIEADMLQLV